MQIVSLGDNLHEMSNPVFWENKKNIINLPSAESAQRVVKVNIAFSDLSNTITIKLMKILIIFLKILLW